MYILLFYWRKSTASLCRWDFQCLSGPCLCYQILNTTCAFKHGKQFPLAYFILPGKSRNLQHLFFTLLNKAVHSPANPVKFPTDFEKALVQAVHRYQFPNSNNSQGLLLPLYPDNLEKNSSSWSSIALRDYWGQHCSSCVLGETCLGTLPVQRGESSSSDETILAARYA